MVYYVFICVLSYGLESLRKQAFFSLKIIFSIALVVISFHAVLTTVEIRSRSSSRNRIQ